MVVREGARVSVADTLAAIVILELEAKLKSSEAKFDFARSTAARSEDLFKRRTITAAEVERYRAALEVVRSTLKVLTTRMANA